MKKFVLVLFMLFSLIIKAQPNFSNQYTMPSWAGLDPAIMCINYHWENSDLSSFSNWNLNGSNINWVINTQNFGYQRGFLYRQDSNVPSFAPVNNYHLVFNYRTTPMEWGPIVSHYYNLNSTSLEEVLSVKYDNVNYVDETYNYDNDNKKVLTFPFNYLDSYTDPFFSDSSGFDTLIATYVGYGNISIPAYGTLYSNVAKIKYSTNVGNFYIFWKDSPWLVPILLVDSLTNNFDLLVDSNLVSSLNDKRRNDYDLFPNPTNSNVNFLLGNNIIYNLKVYDLIGNFIPQLNYNITNNICSLNIQNLDKGIYFISIFTNNGIQTKCFTVFE